MFRLKSLQTSAVHGPESRTDSGRAHSSEVCFPTKLAGGNSLWFNHHYQARAVSHPHFTFLPLQDTCSLPGPQWNRTTKHCLFISVLSTDYIGIRFHPSIKSIHPRHFLVWTVNSCWISCPIKSVTASATCNLYLGGESKLLILGLVSKVSISQFF